MFSNVIIPHRILIVSLCIRQFYRAPYRASFKAVRPRRSSTAVMAVSVFLLLGIVRQFKKRDTSLGSTIRIDKCLIPPLYPLSCSLILTISQSAYDRATRRIFFDCLIEFPISLVSLSLLCFVLFSSLFLFLLFCFTISVHQRVEIRRKDRRPTGRVTVD